MKYLQYGTDYVKISKVRAKLMGLNPGRYFILVRDIELVFFGVAFLAKKSFIFDGCSYPNAFVRFWAWLTGKDLVKRPKISCYIHDISYALQKKPKLYYDWIMFKVAWLLKENRFLATIKLAGVVIGGWPAYYRTSKLDKHNKDLCKVSQE